MQSKANIIVTLLKAYADEGYAVTVGLNPARESRSGAFAILVKEASLKSLPKIQDSHFASIHPLGASPLNRSAIQGVLWQDLKVILKGIPSVRNLYENFRSLFIKSSNELPESPYLLTGGGISYEEIYFFENLSRVFEPKCVFLVGIASGWSTIALGLLNPSATFYGIDNLSEGDGAKQGLELTKKIAQKLAISLDVHIGNSPEHVPEFLEHVSEKIDFAFIDGLHTNEQVFLDFQCILPYLNDSAIMVFHDVLDWNLMQGWSKIVEKANRHGFKDKILRRTTSGMGILFRNVDINVEATIDAFSQHPALVLPS